MLLHHLVSALSIVKNFRNHHCPLSELAFFTFRTVSYLLDVEKGKIKADNRCGSCVLSLTCRSFPSLLSGPIDKARTFIPQLEKHREYSITTKPAMACAKYLWGFFKKIVVANNCAPITNEIFAHYAHVASEFIVLRSIAITLFKFMLIFQAIPIWRLGVSKLLRILTITKNFDYPFFAQSIPEYWRKWHISLTAWLTEYVFTPLSITFRELR